MPDSGAYESCPTCGQRVSVATSDEGTSHFVREAEAEVERLRDENEALWPVVLAAEKLLLDTRTDNLDALREAVESAR